MKLVPSASEENKPCNETVVPRRCNEAELHAHLAFGSMGAPTFPAEVLRIACPEDGTSFNRVNTYEFRVKL